MEHAPGFLALVDAIRPNISEISAREAADALVAGTAILLDVREDGEVAVGRIPGATHLGRGVLERDVEGRFPDPATPLILVCGGGFRSALAAHTLQTMGYLHVASLAGGVRAWQDEGLPWEPCAC
jgi:rhodanese-related sulfurtransferase